MAVGTLSLFYPVFLPASATALAFAGHRALLLDWRALITNFLTGPGRTSRFLLVLFLITNWKSLPFAWTVSCCPSPPSSTPPSCLCNER